MWSNGRLTADCVIFSSVVFSFVCCTAVSLVSCFFSVCFVVCVVTVFRTVPVCVCVSYRFCCSRFIAGTSTVSVATWLICFAGISATYCIPAVLV
ncbi:unnamed protein product [Heterobilharzia americana]|nr:unnamed protein product [Heterobilharzia americana]CAH8669917.1 unnamed protein product [Heterobilharzia americana]